MDATAIIAGYAAVVASGSAVVQYLNWRGQRTVIRLRMSPGTAELVDGVGEAIYIQATNRSGHEVKVINLALQDGDGQYFVVPNPFPIQQPLPVVIPPRDYRVFWVNRAYYEEATDTSKPMRVQVTTAADETFKSKPAVLDTLPRSAMIRPERA